MTDLLKLAEFLSRIQSALEPLQSEMDGINPYDEGRCLKFSLIQLRDDLRYLKQHTEVAMEEIREIEEEERRYAAYEKTLL